MPDPLTLTKEERINSKKLLEQLFDRAAKRTVVAYPLRAVYLVRSEEDDTRLPVRMMVSVPKRQLHHAVDRNRTKRQVREAYRRNKSILADVVSAMPGRSVAIGFVWIDSKLHDSAAVEASVCRLLRKIREAI